MEDLTDNWKGWNLYGIKLRLSLSEITLSGDRRKWLPISGIRLTSKILFPFYPMKIYIFSFLLHLSFQFCLVAANSFWIQKKSILFMRSIKNVEFL